MHIRPLLALLALSCSVGSVGGDFGKPRDSMPNQPILGRRSAPLLTVDGLTFKDLNSNGKLEPYENWRLSADVRAADLVQRLSLEELAGLMVHGKLPSGRSAAPPSTPCCTVVRSFCTVVGASEFSAASKVLSSAGVSRLVYSAV